MRMSAMPRLLQREHDGARRAAGADDDRALGRFAIAGACWSRLAAKP